MLYLINIESAVIFGISVDSQNFYFISNKILLVKNNGKQH
ncbi:hypothetical protein FDUTEX481_03225 [Tolypothrix sp. PCC 7601]|nr:hypothetical protein FDUTEX481_03225 [Tolypothrix sp. PCC 7601]